MQICCSRQRVSWDFPIKDQTQQQVIANATTTCTRMMSSILVSLTLTCPRVNAENEHGIQRIVGFLVFGNFFLTADKLILYHCSGAMWTIQTLAVTQNLAQKGLPITGHVRLAEVNVYHVMCIFFPIGHCSQNQHGHILLQDNSPPSHLHLNL